MAQAEALDRGAAGDARLSVAAKLVYGSGEWGLASYITLRNIFYAIFLTDIVGLDPLLASFAAAAGILWDALNEPFVGDLSDRLRSRWGRRRPFLLVFAVPFGCAFLLLWWAPPWESQIALAVHVTLAFMAADTLQTLLAVPFQALTPAMTPDYDERTSLAAFRMFFNLLASLAVVVGAPTIMDGAVTAGLSPRQGTLLVAALFGGSSILPFFLVFLVARERVAPKGDRGPVLRGVLRALRSNGPFRAALALYMLNWVAVDLVALMLPFFITYWVAGGDMLAGIAVFGETIPLESAVMAPILLVSLAALPAWSWASRRWGKRRAFLAGSAFWVAIQLLVLSVNPGQVGFIVLLAFLAGLSVSCAHVLPDAIFPDVIEWEELRTRRRREGVFYGAKNLARKLAGAVAIFLALQTLGLFGYAKPPDGATRFVQPDSALAAIRVLTGPLCVLFILGAAAAAWFHPLTRARYARVRALLERRRARESGRA